MAGQLDAYHAALVAFFKGKFGDSLGTVQAYFPETQSDDPEAGLTINTPALLVELEKHSTGQDLGDERTAVKCEISIHCILGTGTPNLQQELRNFGVEVQRLLTDKGSLIAGREGFCLGGDAGVEASSPEDVNGMPGWWQKGGASGYDSWAVIFEQTVWIGESVWSPVLLNGGGPVTLFPNYVGDAP